MCLTLVSIYQESGCVCATAYQGSIAQFVMPVVFSRVIDSQDEEAKSWRRQFETVVLDEFVEQSQAGVKNTVKDVGTLRSWSSWSSVRCRKYH